MGEERLDCNWCGSARSIEHGICQICLMEYPLDTRVIALPMDRPAKDLSPRIQIDLSQTESELGVAE